MFIMLVHKIGDYLQTKTGLFGQTRKGIVFQVSSVEFERNSVRIHSISHLYLNTNEVISGLFSIQTGICNLSITKVNDTMETLCRRERLQNEYGYRIWVVVMD